MASYWLTKNRVGYQDILTEDKILSLTPVLKLIQDAVTSEKLNPYISVICRPKSFSQNELFKEPLKVTPEEYKSRKNMIQSRFELFKFLYDNKDIPLTVNRICQELWNDSSSSRQTSLYSYIHDLRKIFATDETKLFSIVKHENSRYEFKCHFEKEKANEYLNFVDDKRVAFSCN